MPPKKDKKRLVSTDTTDSSEAVDHDDQRLSDVIPTASITDSALGMLRQELLEMKSGIQKRLDVVITNQESLLSRITDMEKKYEDLEKLYEIAELYVLATLSFLFLSFSMIHYVQKISAITRMLPW